jgi:hypothetical protein
MVYYDLMCFGVFRFVTLKDFTEMMCRMFGADDDDASGTQARDMMHSLVQVRKT